MRAGSRSSSTRRAPACSRERASIGSSLSRDRGHGGQVRLVEIRDDVVYVTMGGGCQGCGMASVTLTQGIKELIREAAPEIVDVEDVTDHAAGTNPYYEPE